MSDIIKRRTLLLIKYAIKNDASSAAISLRIRQERQIVFLKLFMKIVYMQVNLSHSNIINQMNYLAIWVDSIFEVATAPLDFNLLYSYRP